MSPKWMSRRCKRHWIGLPTPTCCSSRALRLQANYRFKHALIQDAAYESLLKSRRQALHRRAAEALREAKDAEPEAIAHHFTEAGLDDLAIEWWGKAGDQALRRSAFQEAIAHLGKAIAMADKAAGADSPRAAGDQAAAHRRMKLQTDYGQAVMWSKGFAAEETKAAFARAAELAAKSDDFSERFAAASRPMDLGARAQRPQVGAGVGVGIPAGSGGRGPRYRGRRRAPRPRSDLLSSPAISRRRETHCERALDIFDPTMKRRRGTATASTRGPLRPPSSPLTIWQLGEVERARELIDIANRRAIELGHPPSMAASTYREMHTRNLSRRRRARH